MKKIELTKKEFNATKQALTTVVNAIESYLDGIKLEDCCMFGIFHYYVTLRSLHDYLCKVLKKIDCAESEAEGNEE